MTRKKANIKKRMKTMIKEAKEDWLESKNKYTAQKKKLLGEASNIKKKIPST